jgi:hypothetical protein
MDMSIKNKQVTVLNSLTKYMDNNPLAKDLNRTLDDVNNKAIGNFLNGLTSEEFITIKKDKRLKIENPLLAKMLNCKLIDNREEYLNKHVIYDIGFDLDNSIRYKLSYFLRHEEKKISFCSKNKNFLESLFSNPTSFNDKVLNDFEAGLTIHHGRYSFNKNAFSEEFNKSYIDYVKNYEIYVNHPRVGKKKLLEIAEALVQTELPNGKTTLLIDFENFSVEFENSKNKA